MTPQRGTAQQRVSNITSTGAPILGINDIDPLPTMREGYAISMHNFYPANSSMQTRAGTRKWVEGLPEYVDRLFTYNAIDGSQQFFAATNSGIYDISNDTSINPALLVHPLTDGAVTTTQYSLPSGQYLVLANGRDAPALYNGTTWTSFTSGTGGGAGVVEGGPTTLSSLDRPIVFKGRLWFIEADTLTAWFLDTDALGGTLTPFHFNGIMPRGGFLYELATWSYDSGAGMDDNMLVRSSAGDVAIYQGTDPEDPTAWSLVSTYFVAAPVGTISYADLGGDCILLTAAGLVPISKVVSGAATESLYENTLSRNISTTLSRLVRSASFSPNWEIHTLTGLNALVVSIPETASDVARQFVMNIQTGAWGEYGLLATCFGVYRGTVYFGTAEGAVFAHDVKNPARDNVDYDGSGGTPIISSFLTAFNYYGDPTTLKHYKLLRPIVQASLEPVIRATLALDFQLRDTTTFYTPQPPTTGSSEWDSALWDEGVWGNQLTIYRPWTSVIGLGFCAAVRVQLTTVAPTSFVAYETVFETGGAI